MAGIGPVFRITDPPTAAEIRRIFEILAAKVTSKQMNIPEVCEAIGKNMKDGQLECLKRFSTGKVLGVAVGLIQNSDDYYALQAVKSYVAGAVQPAVFFSMDDPTVPALRVEQQGDGRVVHLKGGKGASEPILFLEQGAGTYHMIATTEGAHLTAGGVWTDHSSRKAKTEIKPARGLMEKIKAIPLNKFRFKKTKERHIGPMADDFHRIFQLGSAEGVAAYDVSGIALAGVQEIIKRLEKLEKKIAKLTENKHGRRSINS